MIQFSHLTLTVRIFTSLKFQWPDDSVNHRISVKVWSGPVAQPESFLRRGSKVRQTVTGIEKNTLFIISHDYKYLSWGQKEGDPETPLGYHSNRQGVSFSHDRVKFAAHGINSHSPIYTVLICDFFMLKRPPPNQWRGYRMSSVGHRSVALNLFT